jgi:nitroreductase
MVQIMEVIKKRISIRAYKDKSLPDDVINSILEAAKNAPSARNLQQLEYKVITNKDLIKRTSDVIAATLKQDGRTMQFPDRPNFFYAAPLLIIITGPEDNQWIYSDAGLAAQNIMLYATSVNLGSCFIGMTRFIEKDEKMLKELHISEGMRIAAAVVCGYSNEKPLPKEKSLKAEYFK